MKFENFEDCLYASMDAVFVFVVIVLWVSDFPPAVTPLFFKLFGFIAFLRVVSFVVKRYKKKRLG